MRRRIARQRREREAYAARVIAEELARRQAVAQTVSEGVVLNFNQEPTHQAVQQQAWDPLSVLKL